MPGPNLISVPTEELMEELAKRIARKVKKEMEVARPSSITWPAMRVRECLEPLAKAATRKVREDESG